MVRLFENSIQKLTICILYLYKYGLDGKEVQTLFPHVKFISFLKKYKYIYIVYINATSLESR